MPCAWLLCFERDGERSLTLAKIFRTVIPNGTNVCFDGFWWSSPSNLFAARGRGGPQTNWKASGRFLFIWLRRRRWPRDTAQKGVFVGTDHFWRHLWKVRKNNHLSMVFLSNNHTKKSFFLLFSYLKEERECQWSRLFRMYDSPKAIFVWLPCEGGSCFPFFHVWYLSRGHFAIGPRHAGIGTPLFLSPGLLGIFAVSLKSRWNIFIAVQTICGRGSHTFKWVTPRANSFVLT